MSVLIVEDDLDLADVISSFFDELGMTADIASSAEQGLECISKKNYQLYLIDIVLPQMSGIELTKRIISLEQEAKIVVMTGGGEGIAIVDQILLDAARHKGALHSLAKPFSFDEVKELVNRFCPKDD